MRNFTLALVTQVRNIDSMTRWRESEQVKAELKREGRTRAWLVAKTGTTKRTMDEYLAGRRRPPDPVLILIEQALPALTGKLLTQAEKETA